MWYHYITNKLYPISLNSDYEKNKYTRVGDLYVFTK